MVQERIKVSAAERYLMIDEHKVRVYVREADNKQNDSLPLLVCNGLGMSIETILPFSELLTDRTVIHFDVPAVGKSSLPETPLTLGKYADISIKVIEELGFDEVDLIGISWGGTLAQEITRKFPDKINKLILAVTSAGSCVTVPGPIHVMMELAFPLRYFNRFYSDYISGQIYGGEVKSSPALANEHDRRNIEPSINGYYSQLMSSRSWASLPWLHTVKHETLVIAGKDDPIIPSVNQKILVSLLPNATLHVINCGHLLMVTKAKEVSTLVKEFLQETSVVEVEAC